jgi:aromatic ring-opening dioxygenase LigB subunit
MRRGTAPVRTGPAGSGLAATRLHAAKADSLWQLLMLQGATSSPAELLAYAAPTYYGMAVAIVS